MRVKWAAVLFVTFSILFIQSLFLLPVFFFPSSHIGSIHSSTALKNDGHGAESTRVLIL
jgi:hypothetical protein